MERYPYYPPGFMRAEQTMNIKTHEMHHEAVCDELPLAQATIGKQKWREIYERDKGLMRGTIFCELDKPFRGSSR